jgi:hypothetical protein
MTNCIITTKKGMNRFKVQLNERLLCKDDATRNIQQAIEDLKKIKHVGRTQKRGWDPTPQYAGLVQTKSGTSGRIDRRFVKRDEVDRQRMAEFGLLDLQRLQVNEKDR